MEISPALYVYKIDLSCGANFVLTQLYDQVAVASLYPETPSSFTTSDSLYFLGAVQKFDRMHFSVITLLSYQSSPRS